MREHISIWMIREGVISSNPETGAAMHGLTSNGRAQARAAATSLIEQVCSPKITLRQGEEVQILSMLSLIEVIEVD